MNIYEQFQDNESSLNSAYNSNSLNDSMHNVPYCDQDQVFNTLETTSVISEEIPIEKSTISNLWDFLGISKLPNKDKGCLFDCSIHGTRCLEKCKYKNPKKCKYRCLKNGLHCSKKCIIKPDMHTQSITSNNSNNSNNSSNNSGNNSNTSCDVNYPLNPNGSYDNIAGISSMDGRIIGLMPHFERSYLKYQLPYIPEEYSNIKISPWIQIIKNIKHI